MSLVDPLVLDPWLASTKGEMKYEAVFDWRHFPLPAEIKFRLQQQANQERMQSPNTTSQGQGSGSQASAPNSNGSCPLQTVCRASSFKHLFVKIVQCLRLMYFQCSGGVDLLARYHSDIPGVKVVASYEMASPEFWDEKHKRVHMGHFTIFDDLSEQHLPEERRKHYRLFGELDQLKRLHDSSLGKRGVLECLGMCPRVLVIRGIWNKLFVLPRGPAACTCGQDSGQAQASNAEASTAAPMEDVQRSKRPLEPSFVGDSSGSNDGSFKRFRNGAGAGMDVTPTQIEMRRYSTDEASGSATPHSNSAHSSISTQPHGFPFFAASNQAIVYQPALVERSVSFDSLLRRSWRAVVKVLAPNRMEHSIVMKPDFHAVTGAAPSQDDSFHGRSADALSKAYGPDAVRQGFDRQVIAVRMSEHVGHAAQVDSVTLTVAVVPNTDLPEDQAASATASSASSAKDADQTQLVFTATFQGRELGLPKLLNLDDNLILVTVTSVDDAVSVLLIVRRKVPLAP